MRFLFDILHPAHVHVLRHPRELLLEAGHDVVVTARDKDVAGDLLQGFDIPHTVLSSRAVGTAGLAKELVLRTAALRKIVRAEKIDALVGLMGPSIAPIGRLLGVPSFVLYDTEVATRTNRWVYPMATEVITPACYQTPVRGNHVTYNGYHELAYLHPNRFIPDASKLSLFGLGLEVPYIFVRLPSLVSSHDGSEHSVPTHAWLEWFRRVETTFRVVVSSEAPLPPALDRYRLEGPVTEVHHVLAHASGLIGESATMAAEAAVLATPAVFIGATTRGYVDDIEQRYGLIRRFAPHEFLKATEIADLLFRTGADEAVDAQARLIADHVDVSSWLVNHLVERTSRYRS